MPVDLSGFPRTVLGVWPTPLHECPRLSGELGGPRVLLKRDDVNGLGGGGNKLRKLEFLLGDALADGADTVITFGALQTNHGRQTAAACARLGLRCELVLTKTVQRSGPDYEHSGNLVLDQLYGAHVHVCADGEETGATYQRLLDEAATQQRNVATIPVGGSNGVGVLGYLAAGFELLDQLAERGLRADRVVVPCGSGGTAAGLALALALRGWPGTLDAVCVSRDEAQTTEILHDLVGQCAAQLGLPAPGLGTVRVLDGCLGDGYGHPTPQMWQALRTFGRTEGVALDPVYSGKAAAALAEEIGAGRIGAAETVVFLHTGGFPGLYGYLPDFAVEAAR